MIDIHTHLIPAIDDGSKSVEETLNLIKEAEQVGFTDIILTPHFIQGYYDNSGKDIVLLKDTLQRVLQKNNICVNLYAGMEIYILEEFAELISKGIITPLANSKYMLIEFPMNNIVKYIDEVLFLLQNMGYHVIIAHPERYKYVQEDIEYAKKWVEEGALLQSNYGSIVEIYGKEAKNTLKKLLQLDLVSFLATDCHRQGTFYPLMPQILRKLKKYISEQKIHELAEENPRKILTNEEF